MKLNRTIVSSSIGNALEWYEYMLYAHFSHIISNTFFPSQSSTISMTLTLAVFAVGFLSRPLGALVFGFIGDRFGRKLAITISIALIAIPTTAMGLMPSFATIGITAPIAIIIIRILQGISLGGEYSASLVFLVESAPENKKGFFGSFSTASIALGMVFSSVVIFILNVFFTENEINSFAWRIPFLTSFIIGFVGIYIRKKLKDSEEFTHQVHEKHPIKVLFSQYFKRFVLCCGMFATATVNFFFLAVFLKILMKTLGYSEMVIAINYFITMIVFMIASVLFGQLSDSIPARKILLIAAITIACSILPCLYFFSLHNALIAVICSSMMAIYLGAYLGVMPTLFVKQFPISVRATGVALSYNIPVMFFGGTTPIIMNFLMNYFHSIYGVACYIIFACTISIASLVYSFAKKLD